MIFRTKAATWLVLASVLTAPVVMGGCAHAPSPDLATVPVAAPEALGFDANGLKALDAAMGQAVANGEIAGLSTLLVRHGKVVQFNTYGQASVATNVPMGKDTIHRIFSMTKPVTGVALMILYEEGKWNLDDPVSKYLPELANPS